MPRLAVTDRRARVEFSGGEVVTLVDLGAELVAVVACTVLSPRTLRLLLAVALEEERLVLIEHGSVTVDLSPAQLRLHLHQSRPRVELDGHRPRAAS